jgi:hypothetical protein
MLAIVGFAVGYFVGAKAGQDGLDQLVKAWRDIQTSDEFAALIETGRSLLAQAARQAIEAGGGVLTSEVKDRLHVA